MMTRIVITLDKSERHALGELAEQEYREPRAQAALIIRRELERRGFLPKLEAELEMERQDETEHTTK